jgi:undecaprenyl pyrophosphate synthase
MSIKKGRRPSFTDEEIIAAINKFHAALFLAADELGCTVRTIDRRAVSTPAVAEAIKRWRGRRVDKAELKLEQAIDAGEQWAITFTLRTLGKERGYVERQEVTGAAGGPVAITTVEIVKDYGDNAP